MELLKDAELMEIKNERDHVLFACVYPEKRIYAEVKWNKGDYDLAKGEIVVTDEKKKQVDEWCHQYFDLPMEDIESAVGRTIDVYVYDTFCSFWQADMKFKPEDAGTSFETEIDEVSVDNDGIVVRYYWNGERYKTNYRFTKLIDNQYFVDPQKKRRQMSRFEEKFGLPVDRVSELKGLPIKVTIKKAMNKYAFGEIEVV